MDTALGLFQGPSQDLTLNNSHLDIPSDNDVLNKLRTLDLGENRITELSEIFSGLENLLLLHISHNDIFTSLQKLNLSHNSLTFLLLNC